MVHAVLTLPSPQADAGPTEQRLNISRVVVMLVAMEDVKVGVS